MRHPNCVPVLCNVSQTCVLWPSAPTSDGPNGADVAGLDAVLSDAARLLQPNVHAAGLLQHLFQNRSGGQPLRERRLRICEAMDKVEHDLTHRAASLQSAKEAAEVRALQLQNSVEREAQRAQEALQRAVAQEHRAQQSEAARAAVLRQLDGLDRALIASSKPQYWHSEGDPPQRHPSEYLSDVVTKCLANTGKRITSVVRLENHLLWQKYQAECAVIRERHKKRNSFPIEADAVLQANLHAANSTNGLVAPSDAVAAGINEVYLFHGTSQQSADGIAENGFDTRYSGVSVATYFGHGTYFASDVRKALGYSSGVLFVARVALGAPIVVTASCSTIKRPPPLQPGDPFEADSVIGQKPLDSMAEFVVFQSAQAYPEYLITVA